MELTIPLQTFETGKVRLGPPGLNAKPLAPLAYSDGDIQFHCLSLLLPMLTVKSYDAHTGRLAISFQGASSSATKMQALQDMILSAVFHQQRSWFPRERLKSFEEIRDGFQPIVDHGTLYLYCPSLLQSNQVDIRMYRGGVWSQANLSEGSLPPGTPIRLAIKMQGISFHQHPMTGMWTGKFRIQHRVLAILIGGTGEA